ncbi:MAG: 3'-5' exonuclease [Bacillota bacterium]
MNYIVLDLEFNQSFPFPKGRVIDPIPECPFEIIQIGAVKLNDSFHTIDTFDCYIEPVIYPRLHPIIGKLTGIKKADLNGQPSFPEAMQAFAEFIGIDDAIICTWGQDDIKSLFRNIVYYEIDPSCITYDYFNVQTFATSYLNYEIGKEIGLKNATLELNLDTALSFHNALNDAIYTSEIFKIVRPKNCIPLKFDLASLLEKKLPKRKINFKALYQDIATQLGKESLSAEECKLVRCAYKAGFKNSYTDTEPKK